MPSPVARVDLVPVKVLVLQRLEDAFADAVLAGALAAGADPDQLWTPCDEGRETAGFEAGSVVGDQRDRPDLAALVVGEQ
jgi:hypothetical protein